MALPRRKLGGIGCLGDRSSHKDVDRSNAMIAKGAGVHRTIELRRCWLGRDKGVYVGVRQRVRCMDVPEIDDWRCCAALWALSFSLLLSAVCLFICDSRIGFTPAGSLDSIRL